RMESGTRGIGGGPVVWAPAPPASAIMTASVNAARSPPTSDGQIRANICVGFRPAQEVRRLQLMEEELAGAGVEAPKPLRLAHGEMQPWHFCVLRADEPQAWMKMWGYSDVHAKREFNGCATERGPKTRGKQTLRPASV